MNSARWAVALAIALTASLGWADSHRGSLGLTVAGGFEPLTAIGATGSTDRGFRAPVELGATVGLFEKTSLRLAGRVGFPIPSLTSYAVSFYAGARNGFSLGQWVTFFDIDLAVHVAPLFAIGARLGFGVQYDVLPIMGVYAQLGAQLAGGATLRLSGEVLIGVQFRTYLFE